MAQLLETGKRIWVDAETHKLAKERARLEGIQLKDLVKKAIEMYVSAPLLGQILLERGLITPEQLEQALKYQEQLRTKGR